MIDELIAKIVSGEITIRAALEQCLPRTEAKVQIVIAPRGWIFVGYTEIVDQDLVISRASVIRIWGTTSGIGELVSGPTPKTKLDPAGVVRVPLSAVLARIDCEVSKWASVLK